jgi:hypothetical protein
MTNGPWPPDPPPERNPDTGRLDWPVKCALCGAEWHPPDKEPCMHDRQELETFFASQPPGPEQRRRWIPMPHVEPTWKKRQEERKARQTRQS